MNRKFNRKLGVFLRGLLVISVIAIVFVIIFFFSRTIWNLVNNTKKSGDESSSTKSSIILDNENNNENIKNSENNQNDVGTDTKKSKKNISDEEPAEQNLVQRFSYVKNEVGSIYVMLNKKNGLPENYKPKDMIVPDIPFPFTNDTPKKYMVREAADALGKLSKAANEAGIKIYGISGYRSYSTQKGLYNNYVNIDGQEAADKYSAKAGYSEHQSGLVMDVSSKSESYTLEQTFGSTKEGTWVAQNAHKFGFIVRYLKDKEEITGYSYEPWHLRYIGVEVATYMYENHLSLEEFYDLIEVDYIK